MTNMVNKIPKSNLIIMSSDINAAISTYTHTSEEKDNNINLNFIGPHRNKKLNQRGINILALMNQLNLRAVSTFYPSKFYDTWIHPAPKEGYQLAHFFIQQYMPNTLSTSNGK